MTFNPFKNHLFWFVLLGASIFLIDAFRERNDTIIIDQSVATRLANLWYGQMQREPTTEELSNLIQNWIDEEMLYREALRLEMDAEDTIVRRRLVQKLNFVAEESVPESPSEQVLHAFFVNHADQYALPARYSFSQVRLARIEDSDATLDKLNAGADLSQIADSNMLAHTWADRTAREIMSDFGGEFALRLTELTPGTQWQGPIPSDFGWHLVRLIEKLEPGAPDYASVRPRVLNDFIYNARAQARATFIDNLRSQYDVEWRLD